jgi:hypothetical protein
LDIELAEAIFSDWSDSARALLPEDESEPRRPPLLSFEPSRAVFSSLLTESDALSWERSSWMESLLSVESLELPAVFSRWPLESPAGLEALTSLWSTLRSPL